MKFHVAYFVDAPAPESIAPPRSDEWTLEKMTGNQRLWMAWMDGVAFDQFIACCGMIADHDAPSFDCPSPSYGICLAPCIGFRGCDHSVTKFAKVTVFPDQNVNDWSGDDWIELREAMMTAYGATLNGEN